jgi:two-component system, OmpR family, response regulator RegX3
VTTTATAPAALSVAADVVIVDRGLPGADSFEVCRELRRVTPPPIIVLTGGDDEADRIAGLDIGADHYLAKPVQVRELVARVRASGRRRVPQSPDAERVGDSAHRLGGLTIDHRTRRAVVDGEVVALTPKEYDVLEFLAAQPDRAHSTTSIARAVWDPYRDGPTKTVTTQISKLHTNLGADISITKMGCGGYQLQIANQ